MYVLDSRIRGNTAREAQTKSQAPNASRLRDSNEPFAPVALKHKAAKSSTQTVSVFLCLSL